ncbi:MAG: amidohydrolase family protein, partial [Syntrophothermus sp.]
MLILKNATILNFDPPQVLKDQDVLIEGGRIADVGKGIAEGVTASKIIDLSGKYISPGLVCAHNHFYSALARGIVADIKSSTDFIGILQHLWWKLDRALDEESLYYSGITGALEAIKCGTTSVIDHNASPAFINGSHQLLKECFENAGLRGILCYEVTCRNGKEETDKGIRETEDFIHSLSTQRAGKLPLIEAAVGA